MPNIGIEVPIGRRFSVAADWMYAWWSRNRSHNYWRIYGGEIEGRYWIGDRADYKPLHGHHIGLYAQAVTYDFIFGGHGYMVGVPKGSLWDKASFGAGVSYGYACTLTRNIIIDFSIGIGYLGGDYQKYHPEDECYVYDSTRRLNYIGPTRAEVSIVWPLHFGKREKGGAQ